MDRKILVTGDYWHREFKSFLASVSNVILTPIKNIGSIANQTFDLIIIAQSLPDQIPLHSVEQLQNNFPTTPIVAVLGSWCEGELRTGNPWPGVLRIYWHQWQGRYDTFIEELESGQITGWHTPRTSTTTDRVMQVRRPHFLGSRNGRRDLIGISAQSSTQFEMLRDAIEHFGYRARSIEQTAWDAATIARCKLICVDAESLTQNLVRRIEWLQNEFPESALTVIASFPRANEVERLVQMGVAEVVSKPFEMMDLRSAIERCVEYNPAAEASVHRD